jgi:hypothetical protein
MTDLLLQPHQARVVEERADLTTKIHKLDMFFGTPIFASLAEMEQVRLKRQHSAMQTYSEILGERIAAF